MFTAEDQPLLSGSDQDIDEFVDCKRCIILDWRGTEEETIEAVMAFLPDLSFENIGTDSIALRIRFQNREDLIRLPFQPQNNFRVFLRVWRLLQPDYDIKFFRITDEDDTHGFLIRPTNWWTTYRAKYPQQYQKTFRDVTDLNQLWNLESQSKPEAPKTKPWWRFW